jgi:alkylation response protein AidB-like acyl-CoA dehydrogenase
MDMLLSREQRMLVERVAHLANSQFVGRAAQYDRTTTFPAEDFDDLFRASLQAPFIPQSFGGLGLDPNADLLALWMMTKELAKADLSLARCWEGHVNSQMLLSVLGNAQQRSRWFEGIVQRGEKWAAWSGEPQSRVPGQEATVGTTVRVVRGGYIVHGTKMFATSGVGAHWAILLVNLHGPGGARHTSTPADGLLLLVCDLREPSIRFDKDSWDPIGMRATVSHMVHFDHTFLPAEHLLGQPGQYLREHWQARFSPHYGASFLGAAEAAFAYARAYVQAQKKEQDPYVQHRIATMALNVESGHLWLRHVASLWREGRHAEARAAGNRARFLLECYSTDTVEQAIRACGARCLLRPSALEQIYRDLSFYVRHDNADHVLATVGREVLDEPHDASFHTV